MHGNTFVKIVVTGATGYLGRNLVPIIQAHGHEVLLVGRDKAKLRYMFSGFDICEYSELALEAKDCSMLLHLAVLNNDSRADIESFYEVNVKGALDIATKARQAGIETFINVSSTHALDPANTSPYAVSKRKAAEELEKLEGINVISIYLPYVYNANFAERLTFLRKMPPPLARLAFYVVSSVKPMVSVKRVAFFIEEIAVKSPPASFFEPNILSDGQSSNPVFSFVKRSIDLCFALIIAIFFWWLLLLIWFLVRLESPGPGIFTQERVGREGEIFICYKFRTMKIGTANMGTHQVGASSVTRFGQILRKYKLDELPQVLNILRNEISLIGPRPCLPVQTELVEARQRLGVLALKPGISGLAQVNGIDMSDPVELARCDARYRAMQAFAIDLKIIIATALGSGNGDRVVNSP